MSSNSSSSSSLVSTAASYTGPRLPVILPEVKYDNGRPSSSRAFLSKTPAPGSSIEVQTLPREYQIWVKLPGFTWDGITVATQRQAVLHIVADKWDNNGGHFEQKVEFDYDADLSEFSVKAEFRDDWLRVSVPRRPPPITTQQSSRYAPIGRSS